MSRTRPGRSGLAAALIAASLTLTACRASADPVIDARHARAALAAARALPRHAPGERYVRPSDRAVRRVLTPLQYKVTREEGTERPFSNAYWNNKRAGIYVDIVSGEPLFASVHKYKSGTGWPSFFRPLEPENVVQRSDTRLMMARTEVRSRHGDSHLGHLFRDGPRPTGLRYCINSAALRFVPKDRLVAEGYGKYAKLFAHGR